MLVHMIGNAHIDPVWLWPWQAGADEALATLPSAADRCDEYPEFIFTRGEAWLYRQVERLHPDLFARIRALVERGQWHITGGQFIQPDLNLPTAAGLHRQLEHGQRYFRDRFGVAPDRRLQRRQLRPYREPAGHPRRARLHRLRLPPPGAAPGRAARQHLRLAGRRRRRGRRLPHRARLRRQLRRPDRAGEDRRRERRSGARPHHVLLRRRQPRRRPVEGDDRVDPRQPRASTGTSWCSRRRRRSSRRSPTSATCCRASRSSCSTPSPAATASCTTSSSAQRHGEQLLEQAEARGDGARRRRRGARRALARLDARLGRPALHRVPRHPDRHLDPRGLGLGARHAGPRPDHRRGGAARDDAALVLPRAAARERAPDRRRSTPTTGRCAASSRPSPISTSTTGATAGSATRTASPCRSRRCSRKRTSSSRASCSRRRSAPRPAASSRCGTIRRPAPRRATARMAASPDALSNGIVTVALRDGGIAQIAFDGATCSGPAASACISAGTAPTPGPSTPTAGRSRWRRALAGGAWQVEETGPLRVRARLDGRLRNSRIRLDRQPLPRTSRASHVELEVNFDERFTLLQMPVSWPPRRRAGPTASPAAMSTARPRPTEWPFLGWSRLRVGEVDIGLVTNDSTATA